MLTYLPTKKSLKGKVGMDWGKGGCSNKPYLRGRNKLYYLLHRQMTLWPGMCKNLQFSMTCCGIGQGGKQTITLSGFIPEKVKLVGGCKFSVIQRDTNIKPTNPGLILCLSQPP